MGKGQRDKLKRKEPLPRASLDVLQQAFSLVGERFGSDAKCVEAAAMLRGISKHLGYDLQVRPVSVGINDEVSGKSVCMGPKILASLTPEQRDAVHTDFLEDETSLGHVVLTNDSPALLMDPNLRQVNRMGVDVANLFVTIEDANPESGQWEVSGKGVAITYLLDPDASSLLENFEEYSAIEEADYRLIASALRRGQSVELSPEP